MTAAGPHPAASKGNMGPLRRAVATVLVVTFLAPAAALAQQPEPGGPKPSAGADQNTIADSPRDTLPVSLERIRRELAATKPRPKSQKDGLRLEYYVEVYGRAPRIELFLPRENITNAPVMYGGMTHQEFLKLVTPQEFSAPAANIPGALIALMKWLSDKNKSTEDSKK